MKSPDLSSFSCPVPRDGSETILLAHGGGGRLTASLFEKVFFPAFRNRFLAERHDGAILPVSGGRIAFTTDSYVVRPLFFPGGDIGKLAVCGTVNDLAMCGARPRFLSAAFIIEEGFPTETLSRIVESMRIAAGFSEVEFVTGDTKVVEHGKGDGVFINTAGIGLIEHSRTIGPSAVRPGDRIVLSGDIGRHGLAILSAREGFDFSPAIESDCASLCATVMALFSKGLSVHCLRDLTRGGLAAALVEIAGTRGLGFRIDEAAIPVTPEVQGPCEVLGLDVLHIANEGRFIAILPSGEAEDACRVISQENPGSVPKVIGEVLEIPSGKVTIATAFGTARTLDLPTGEPLPRIC